MLDRPLEWIAAPHIPLDFRGPTDRAFTPFGDPAHAQPMIERLGRVGARRADHSAVIDDAGTLTYGQLLRQVARLTAAIAQHEAAIGPVGILLPIGRAYVVAVYACLAARRLAVMLDAEHPSERNAAMIGATDVKLLLTSGPGMASVAEVSALALEPLDNVGPLPVAGLDSARELLDVDAPAFILCTSGSTGAPKAIVHSQRNLLHMARTGHDGFHFGEDDRLLALSSPAALGGLAPLLHVPLTGATLQLLNLKARGISGLFSDLQRYPISILGAAPSLLRGLSRLPAAGAAFASTRIEQTYGEPLTRDDVRLLRTVLPAKCDIRNGYGATEAGGMSWFAQVDDEHDPIRIAAGAPMPDTEAALIDADGAPCAAGEVGELVFRSRYAALDEYVGGQPLPGSQQRDPDDASRRIYRTGDLARHDGNGVFVVLGRADRMININGQRTEPAEIEAVLLRQQEVEQAEVIVQQRNESAALTAFIVAHEGAAAGLQTRLRAALRQVLPRHMVPARIILLDQLPRLPGGKLDAQALRMLAGGDA